MRRLVFFIAISLALFAFLPSPARAAPGDFSIQPDSNYAGAQDVAPQQDFAPPEPEIPPAGPDTAFRGVVFPNGAPSPMPKFISASDSQGRELPFVQTRRFTSTEDSVEIADNGNNRRVKFTKISPRALGAILGFEDVPSPAIKIKGAQTVEAYAIDPSQFQFETATITAVATGHYLYKCKGWNFYSQQCPEGGWQKIMDITPGQEYSVQLGSSDPAYSEGDPLQNFNATDYYLNAGTVSAGTLGNTNASDGTTFDIREASEGHSKNATIEVQLAASATIPRHTVWDGYALSWGARANDTAPGGGGTPRFLVMRAAPTRNERILGTLDSSSDVYVQVWNGTGFSGSTVMTAVAPVATREVFDMQYEQVTGDAVVVFLNTTARQVQYRTWNGTAWSAITPLVIGWPGAANARVALYPHNNSDEMMLLVETANATIPSLFASYWNGNSFGTPTLLEKNTSSNNSYLNGKNFDGAWEDSGSAFVAFYAANSTINITYRNYSAGAWQAARNGTSGLEGVNRIVRAASFPGTQNIMACWQEYTNAHLVCQDWNGTEVGAGKEVELHAATYSSNTRNFDVAPVLSTQGGFVLMFGDKNAANFSFYLCNSTSYCHLGQFTTAQNSPIVLWTTNQLGGTATSWGAMEADPNNPGNLTLIGASQTAANGWYRAQIYCNATSCYNLTNSWVSLGGATTSMAYEAAALAFDRHQLYRAEAWHNSTSTNSIPGSATLYGLNATAKFNSTAATSYNLSMYNWTSAKWEQCNAGAVAANVFNTWSCNYSSGFSNLRNMASNGQIRIMLNETTNHSSQATLLEDYVKYFISWEAPPYYDGTAGGAGVNQSNPQPGEWIKFHSLWYEDSNLSNTTLEWNITDSMVNQTWSNFAALNASWSNWTMQIPSSQEGKIFAGRMWANDSPRNFWNATPFFTVTVQNVSPAVSGTFANESDVYPNSPICINASATDVGVGVAYVWAKVTFPNGTSQNVSMSDTGCNAGGAGDGNWGVQINTGATPGNITINTTYANDTIGNLGWQSPLPQIKISSSNAPQYNNTAGYFGTNVSNPIAGNTTMKFYSFWSDDTGLKQYTLEWNATGTLQNQSWLNFPAGNNSWANYSIMLPLAAGGKTVWWRMWANGSSNATPYQQFDGQTPPILVNGTYVNVSMAPVNSMICVNASAGSAGGTIDAVWAMVSFQNGTSQNVSMSDTGCNAGGAGDNNYGAWINVSSPGGNLTVNTTYANDTSGTLAFESPPPNLQVLAKNAIGGSDYYVGFYGTISAKIKQTPASSNSLYNRRTASGNVFITPAGSSPTWTSLAAASAGADMPAMDAALGLSGTKDKLENNYNSGTQAMCGANSVNYMQSSDSNWKIGALYSNESAPSGYSSGDIIIFCAQVNYNAQDAFGTRSDYELSFPRPFATNADVWYDLG